MYKFCKASAEGQRAAGGIRQYVLDKIDRIFRNSKHFPFQSHLFRLIPLKLLQSSHKLWCATWGMTGSQAAGSRQEPSLQFSLIRWRTRGSTAAVSGSKWLLWLHGFGGLQWYYGDNYSSALWLFQLCTAVEVWEKWATRKTNTKTNKN